MHHRVSFSDIAPDNIQPPPGHPLCSVVNIQSESSNPSSTSELRNIPVSQFDDVAVNEKPEGFFLRHPISRSDSDTNTSSRLEEGRK